MAQKFCLFLLTALLIALPVAAQDGRTARSDFMKGYQSYKAGTEAEKRKQLPSAVEQYRDALDVFQQVRQDYPNFEPSVVNYRIGWLKEKIKQLSGEITDQAEQAAKATQEASGGSALASNQLTEIIARQSQRILALEDALSESQRRVRQLNSSVELARAEAGRNAEAADMRDKLLKENREQRNTIKALQDQIDAVVTTNAERGGAVSDAKLLALGDETRALRARVDQLEGERRLAIRELARAKEQIRQQAIELATTKMTDDQAAHRTNQAMEVVEQLTDRVKQAYKVIEQYKTETERLSKDLAFANAEIEDLKALIAGTPGGGKVVKAQEELAIATVQLHTLQADVKSLVVARDQLQVQLDDLQRSNAVLRQRLAKYEAEEDQRVDAGRAEIQVDLEVRRQLDKSLTELADMRQRNHALVDVNRELQNEIRDSRQKYDAQLRLNEMLRQRIQDGAKLGSGSSGVVVPLEALPTETVPSNLEVGDVDKMVRTHRAETQVLNRQIQSLVAQLEEAKTRVAELEDTGSPAPNSREPYYVLPRPVQQILRRAIAAEHAGNRETAIHNYEQVLSIVPDELTSLKRLGQLTYQAGETEKSESYLAHAFYVAPDDREVLIPLGTLYLERDQPILAFSVLSRAAALYPDDAVVHRMFGAASLKAGWTQMAEQSLLLSNQLDPSNADTAMYLAFLYAGQQPPAMKTARKWYSTAKELGAMADPALEQRFSVEN